MPMSPQDVRHVENRRSPGRGGVDNREHGLKKTIQVARRGCLAAQFQNVISGVPPGMNNPGGENRRLACTQQNRLLPASTSKGPGYDRARLALVPVYMQRRPAAARRQRTVDHQSGLPVAVTDAAQPQHFAGMTVLQSQNVSHEIIRPMCD
jgi:hypothetical protein